MNPALLDKQSPSAYFEMWTFHKGARRGSKTERASFFHVGQRVLNEKMCAPPGAHFLTFKDKFQGAIQQVRGAFGAPTLLDLGPETCVFSQKCVHRAVHTCFRSKKSGLKSKEDVRPVLEPLRAPLWHVQIPKYVLWVDCEPSR